MPLITVGAREVTSDQARNWLTDYFDAAKNRKDRKPYAYPAYDKFNAGSTPNELNDGDLLAPGMLNAAPTIAAFYSLRNARGHLQQRLATIDGLVDVLDAEPSFRCALTPPGFAKWTCSPTRDPSPARSASCSTGARPAHDTRFGSSN